LLKLLGREHNAAQAVTSYRILGRAGFTNINIDLMFGLPGQTLAQWKETLRKTIALEPQHISTYCLTYEEDTEFFVKRARGEFREDSDSDAVFLETAMEILERAGFEHYEISNYAREGYTSIHNHGYWAGEDYVGLGPGAFSTVGLKRFQSIANYRTYTDEILAGRPAISATENLTAAIKKSERIALGLRTRRGIPSEELDHRPNERREFQELGFFREVDGHQVLTEKGKLLADSIAEAFV
jgi:oxygen-independent coproporphyrinogen-3 oxidase